VFVERENRTPGPINMEVNSCHYHKWYMTVRWEKGLPNMVLLLSQYCPAIRAKWRFHINLMTVKTFQPKYFYFKSTFRIVATICRLHVLGVLDGAPYYSFAPCYQYKFVVESSIKLCTIYVIFPYNIIDTAFPTTLSQGWNPWYSGV